MKHSFDNGIILYLPVAKVFQYDLVINRFTLIFTIIKRWVCCLPAQNSYTFTKVL